MGEGAPPPFLLTLLASKWLSYPHHLRVQPAWPLISLPSPSPNLHLRSTSTTMATPGGLFLSVLHAFEILNSHISHSDHICQSFHPAIFSVLKQGHGAHQDLYSLAPPFSPGQL